MNLQDYQSLLTTDISDAMTPGFAMDIGMQSLWQPIPRIMGLAYTVRCIKRSNTYLHDAIYKAPIGSIVIVQADAKDCAVAGGNVCAVAKENGIQGFVIDGVVRDIGEIRENAFPVFARGIFPKPGSKSPEGESGVQVTCGGIAVSPGDLIAADEEGIVVVLAAEIETVLQAAIMKKQKADEQTLAEWRRKHQQKIIKLID